MEPQSQQRLCPACQQQILQEATICGHCGLALRPPKPKHGGSMVESAQEREERQARTEARGYTWTVAVWSHIGIAMGIWSLAPICFGLALGPLAVIICFLAKRQTAPHGHFVRNESTLGMVLGAVGFIVNLIVYGQLWFMKQ